MRLLKGIGLFFVIFTVGGVMLTFQKEIGGFLLLGAFVFLGYWIYMVIKKESADLHFIKKHKKGILVWAIVIGVISTIQSSPEEIKKSQQKALEEQKLELEQEKLERQKEEKEKQENMQQEKLEKQQEAKEKQDEIQQEKLEQQQEEKAKQDEIQQETLEKQEEEKEKQDEIQQETLEKQEEEKEKAKYALEDIRIDAVSTCRLAFENMANDPKSIEYGSTNNVLVLEGKNGDIFVAEDLRAKNAFGGLIKTTVACKLKRDNGNHTLVDIKEVN